MFNPRIVCIRNWRHNPAISLESRIINELVFSTPAFKVERRIGHNVVDLLIFMKVIRKCGGVLLSEVMCNAANGEIHFAQPPGIRITFLSNNRNLLPVSLVTIDKFHGLYKHSTTSTAGIVNCPRIRLNHLCDEFYDACRRVEFAVLLCAGGRIDLQEIFVNASDQVFFLKTLLVNLVDVVNQILQLCSRCTERGEESVDRIPVFISGR